MRAVKTRFDGARLHVDGDLLDSKNDLYASEGEATLLGVFGENGQFRVEAFVRPLEHAGAEVRVNGKWVAGNRVYAVASEQVVRKS
jgi:hypothetical protein